VRVTPDLELLRQEVNAHLETFGGRAFVRLCSASSKLTTPVSTFEEVLQNLASSPRTEPNFRAGQRGEKIVHIMLREFVADMAEHMEMRCYVHGRVLRGVSLGVDPPPGEEKDGMFLVGRDPDETGVLKNLNDRLSLLRVALREFIAETAAATEYADFVCDVALPRNWFWTAQSSAELRDKLWLIEINTPVYLLATSGYFCLDSPEHQEILVGACSPLIEYPRMITAYEQRLIEL
jgi:hypothetical protein